MKRKAILILLGLALSAADVFMGWRILPANFLGAFLIFTGLGFCMGGSLFLALGRASGSKALNAQSDRSLLGMAPAALLFLVAMPLEYLFLPASIYRGQAMQWLGFGVVLLGMALRVWARLALKESYQGNLQVQAAQSVVRTGPYRWVRHPGYLAFLLLALGLAMGFSSLSGLAGFILLVFALVARIHLEEQMMAQAFGEEYSAYATHTFQLIPLVW